MRYFPFVDDVINSTVCRGP
uniref:Uncharacterized protein n=1 Tax=Anguilla anguilla TaxID=7936 RepID=A0A0E9VVK4_ANGAN